MVELFPSTVDKCMKRLVPGGDTTAGNAMEEEIEKISLNEDVEIDEDNKITNTSMSDLFNRDLDGPLQRIFLSLDPLSLKASRQVCTQWGDFIARRVWGSKLESLPYKSLRRRLDHHWKYANPNQRTISIFYGEISNLSCDDSLIVCLMVNATAKVFDITTLQLLTALDCYRVEDKKDTSFRSVKDDIAIGKEVICTCTVSLWANVTYVSVWRRSDWSLLYKQCYREEIYKVAAVAVSSNYIITGCSNQVTILRWDGQQVTLMSTLEDFPRSPIGSINSDGDRILVGAGRRLILWRLEDCVKVKSLDTHYTSMIASISLSYPFAMTVGNKIGVTMWDLEKGEVMRNFGMSLFGNVWKVCNNGRFFGSPERFLYRGDILDSVTLYSVEELTNVNVSSGNLFRREGDFRIAFNERFALNTSCLVVAQRKEVHIWDFWNCDQFKDAPDPLQILYEINEFISEDDDDSEDNDVSEDNNEDVEDGNENSEDYDNDT